jgi:CO/xanthine dehydrogenase FAD-binding subunit
VRSAVSSLDLVDPSTLDEALRYLCDQPDLVPLAGATDLYVALNAGQLRARRFLNLWRLDELRGIAVAGNDGTLRLGAMTRYSEIITSPLVAAQLPMLIDAARQTGGVQIHNRGTLGGNIANASPAGDSLPVLAAAEAIVILRSVSGERRVPFNAFYTGYRTSVRRADELIVAIDVPPVAGRQWFRKVGTRAAQAISKVVIAGVRASAPRIAFGSMAPTVVRARQAEQALAAGLGMAAARQALARDLAPIDDFRSTARYRLAVAANLLERFWRETA